MVRPQLHKSEEENFPDTSRMHTCNVMHCITGLTGLGQFLHRLLFCHLAGREGCDYHLSHIGEVRPPEDPKTFRKLVLRHAPALATRIWHLPPIPFCTMHIVAVDLSQSLQERSHLIDFSLL